MRWRPVLLHAWPFAFLVKSAVGVAGHTSRLNSTTWIEDTNAAYVLREPPFNRGKLVHYAASVAVLSKNVLWALPNPAEHECFLQREVFARQ